MEHSRRDFFKGAGTVAAGIGLTAGLAGMAGCVPEENNSSAQKAKYECDVVIAGAGIGGLAAAVSAMEQGSSVVLVEASKKVGGTSRFAAGALGLRFGKVWKEVYAKAPLSDPEFGPLVLNSWDSYIQWVQDLGLTVDEIPGSSYHYMGGRREAAQGSKGFTDEYLQQFGKIFEDMGGTTLLSTTAVRLIVEDGKVVGLTAEDANEKFSIKAKAVIIATGGWQCDKEMLTKYVGRFADISQPQCVPYLTGGGIKMAVEVGAQLSKSFGTFYGHPQPWPMDYLKGADTPEGYEALDNVDQAHLFYYGTTAHSIQGMSVFVNCDGKRFVDESLLSSTMNQELMQQHMARAYNIYDQNIRNIYSQLPFYNAAVIGGDRIENMKKMGMPVVQADSIEELAQKIVTETVGGDQFNAANFIATIKEYNAEVAAGNATKMEIPHSGRIPATPLATPPFFAIPVVPGIMTTFGGIKINTDTEVINTSGRTIPGLYAIPAAAGGIMGAEYWCVMSGYSVLGKIAGKTSSDYAKSLGGTAE